MAAAMLDNKIPPQVFPLLFPSHGMLAVVTSRQAQLTSRQT